MIDINRIEHSRGTILCIGVYNCTTRLPRKIVFFFFRQTGKRGNINSVYYVREVNIMIDRGLYTIYT